MPQASRLLGGERFVVQVVSFRTNKILRQEGPYTEKHVIKAQAAMDKTINPRREYTLVTRAPDEDDGR